MKRVNKTIGIDASRCRSGGAISHIQGLFSGPSFQNYGVETVHLWAPDSLLDSVPDRHGLVKHYLGLSSKPLFYQLYWQAFVLPRLATKYKLDLLFNADSSTLCSFTPCVTLNQDLLAFEESEKSRYSIFSFTRLRLELISRIQLSALSRSSHVIFLSRYAQDLLTAKIAVRSSSIIGHGFDPLFALRDCDCSPAIGESVNILYVSNIEPYKHHVTVVKAVHRIRRASLLDLRLTLIGEGTHAGTTRQLRSCIRKLDPLGRFVTMLPGIPRPSLRVYLSSSDIFVFASSCESFGITLLEAMAAGLPIACSSRSSLPEIAADSALYFDPEDFLSLSIVLEALLSSESLRSSLSRNAVKRSNAFTWNASFSATWSLLANYSR